MEDAMNTKLKTHALWMIDRPTIYSKPVYTYVRSCGIQYVSISNFHALLYHTRRLIGLWSFQKTERGVRFCTYV